MTDFTSYRLDGLEPDNPLAFMALLGLLRVLEETRPEWHVRISWTVNEPPLRPALRVPEEVNHDAIVHAAAEGLKVLAQFHDFSGRKGLLFSPEEAATSLNEATKSAHQNRYAADLWAALLCNGVISRDGKKVKPTPFCMMFGQGHQHFLERLARVPKEEVPQRRGKGQNKISEADCLSEALFKAWKRPDETSSFRWDPNEDVRYALRAHNPTNSKTKETTQHGANRLAAIGLSSLTVAPTLRLGHVDLSVMGGHRLRSEFLFQWPIWEAPISLATIRSLLCHPNLQNHYTQASLGIIEIRQARQISVGKYKNFTRADAMEPAP